MPWALRSTIRRPPKEEYDYVNVGLTNYDVPVARVNLTEFNWMKQNNSTGTVSIKADWNRNNAARRDILVLVLGPDGRPSP